MSDEGRATSDESRRDFLVKSAALAVAGSLLAADEAAAIAKPLPQVRTRVSPQANDPVRIGVIGTGGMGTEHCSANMSLKKAGRADQQQVALADVCKSRLD